MTQVVLRVLQTESNYLNGEIKGPLSCKIMRLTNPSRGPTPRKEIFQSSPINLAILFRNLQRRRRVSVPKANVVALNMP